MESYKNDSTDDAAIKSDSRTQSSDTSAGLSFEQAAARIDDIIRVLEKGDAPLDKSLALFEEGAQLIGVCGKMLDNAEQMVVRLQKSAGGEPEEVDFDDE